MTRYLVTGGAGFIGSWIVERLLGEGGEVRIVDDLSTGRACNLDGLRHQVEFTQGDINDLELMRRLCRGVDVVFHQAALPSVPRSIEAPLAAHHVNASGTATVLEAARLERVRRVVYASSSSLYGGSDVLPKQESMAPTPLSPYAASKLTGEQYCQVYHRCYGLETVALRYFNVFGPRQDPSSAYAAVVPLFVSQLLAGEAPTLYGDGTQTRDFTFVANVAEANWRAANTSGVSGRVYNIGCGVEVNLLQLLEEIGELTGCRPEPVFAPARQGDPKASRADISRAREELGYEPRVGLAEGLGRVVDYFQAQTPVS